MKKPLYSVGDLVLHTAQKAHATIHSIVNLQDKTDVALQGFRYLVYHSGWIWSVPESAMGRLNLKHPLSQSFGSEVPVSIK